MLRFKWGGGVKSDSFQPSRGMGTLVILKENSEQLHFLLRVSLILG